MYTVNDGIKKNIVIGRIIDFIKIGMACSFVGVKYMSLVEGRCLRNPGSAIVVTSPRH